MPTTETELVFTSNYFFKKKKRLIKDPCFNFSRALKANKDKWFWLSSTGWILNDRIGLKKAHGS